MALLSWGRVSPLETAFSFYLLVSVKCQNVLNRIDLYEDVHPILESHHYKVIIYSFYDARNKEYVVQLLTAPR